MPIHDFVWRAPAPRTAAEADSLTILDTVDSTNTMMTRDIAAGAHGGDAVSRIANLYGGESGATADATKTNAAASHALPVAVAVSDTQTKCHGRLGRVWYNRPGQSLLASFAVPAPTALIGASMGGWITMSAGLAVLDAMRDAAGEYEFTAIVGDDGAERGKLTIKWPNDIFCDGRKLAGVLSEFVPVDERWSAVVIGIGLNLFVPRDDLPTDIATSLQLHYDGLPGYATLRDALMAGIVRHLRERLERLYADPKAGVAGVLREIEAVSWTLGRRVEARLADGGSVHGTATAINPDASLTIRDDAGETHVVTTGDVGVMPMPGVMPMAAA
ncbi:biotin--[acetyl-CoA-carboxylase] ligase [Bifidobacterium sp. SMB2]|uniref:biotin--[biotin carboxyl-carrier protein] ligase n=1 Tax=Bifidobacterium saimiriisciurei TaxID=2661627 RepID=A0ABX0C7F7_9BIFI|nr:MULTISPECIES: biotin--[acetyl-CoA-carboxylase] ligase [Bifidobacterium]NEG96306.1 biotin--[acetyl-CoA-carboxylase] ligase [Bifidobacterium sp. SMB2]NEH11062.1 biotin--[acetyl-CoA-carboxylase] ligase [Bifidobacterium saimiriisciurei]